MILGNLASQNKQERFLFANTILNTLSIVEKSLQNNNIKLNLNLDEKIHIEGAKGDISQVLLIIINNAKDAFVEKNIENSEIKIKLYSEKNSVLLEVYDNAGGIDKNIIDKIFDAYYTTKDKINGSGLGLYIVKMIVETKMKGSIEAKQTDDGTCFCIELNKSNSDE